MLRPIKNEEQYEDALQKTYELMQKELAPDSAESDELEMLSILVKEYEHVYHPMPKANPIETIRFRLDQMNMTEKDLTNLLGARSR